MESIAMLVFLIILLIFCISAVMTILKLMKQQTAYLKEIRDELRNNNKI